MSIEEIMKKAQQAAETKKQQDEQNKVGDKVEKVYSDREKQVTLENEREKAQEREEQKQIDLDRIEALRKELGVVDKKLEEVSVAEQQIRDMDIPEEEKEKLITELQVEASKIAGQKQEKGKYISATEASVAKMEAKEKETGLAQEKIDEINAINTSTEEAVNDMGVKDKLHGDALKQNEEFNKEKDYDAALVEDKERDHEKALGENIERLTTQLEKLKLEYEKGRKKFSELWELSEEAYKKAHNQWESTEYDNELKKWNAGNYESKDKFPAIREYDRLESISQRLIREKHSVQDSTILIARQIELARKELEELKQAN